MNRRTSQRGTERGAALVELAIALPVLGALVLGTITFAQAHFERLAIEDSVRDGTRFAATMETFAAATVRQRVVTLAGGEVELDEVCAALVTAPDATDACGLDDPPGTSAGDELVKVSATHPASVNALFFRRDITLRGESVAVYER